MATGTPGFGFWCARPRRSRHARDTTASSTAINRRGPSRMRTSPILRQPVDLTVNFEVERFKIYGTLRRTKTEVHNSLPTLQTIQTEKTLMSFDETRRMTPDGVPYDDFYRSLTSSITPLPAPQTDTARSTKSSSRKMDTLKTTTFTMFPDIPAHTPRPLRSVPSVLSRLTTSYGLTVSETKERLNATRNGSTLSTWGQSRDSTFADSSGMNSHSSTPRHGLELDMQSPFTARAQFL